VSNSLGSTTVIGAGVMIYMTKPQHGGSHTMAENGLSQDLLEDSMPNDGGKVCNPCVLQDGTETATAHSTPCPRKRISFVHRCIRATKTVFMISHEGNLF
jgi:hypothetical protein